MCGKSSIWQYMQLSLLLLRISCFRPNHFAILSSLPLSLSSLPQQFRSVGCTVSLFLLLVGDWEGNFSYAFVETVLFCTSYSKSTFLFWDFIISLCAILSLHKIKLNPSPILSTLWAACARHNYSCNHSQSVLRFPCGRYYMITINVPWMSSVVSFPRSSQNSCFCLFLGQEPLFGLPFSH